MVTQLRMPALSQSMLTGRIAEWLKREGDRVSKGEPLVLVESDKATNELEAPQDGVLRRILVAVGEEADVDVPIAIIAEPNEDISALGVGETNSSVPTVTAPSPATVGQLPAEGRRPASPAAKRLAKELGIDLTRVPGTGEDGLITEKTVRAFASPAAAAPSPNDSQIVPLTGLRGRIAERVSLSRHTAADVTTVVDVDMGAGGQAA